MKTLLMGGVAMLVLQVVLVGMYLAVDSQDPIILNPESGSLQENGVTMLMFCGQNSTLGGSGRGVLDNVPPDGDVGAWTKGRTVQGDCDIWYHHSLKYNPHAHEACLIGCDHDWLERRLR